jgi:hypothetical protein
MQMAALNLWLDSYDDIYSDFDSQHYLKRRISEDFLHELHIELKHREDSKGGMALLVPEKNRDTVAEKNIAVSLATLFSKRYLLHQKKCKTKLKNGILLFLLGALLMLLNTWLNYKSNTSFAMISLKVMLEPAGWFLVWAAFDILYYDYANLKIERDFYKTMSEMKIQFQSA